MFGVVVVIVWVAVIGVSVSVVFSVVEVRIILSALRNKNPAIVIVIVSATTAVNGNEEWKPFIK